jgi:hypothetical protein
MSTVPEAPSSTSSKTSLARRGRRLDDRTFAVVLAAMLAWSLAMAAGIGDSDLTSHASLQSASVSAPPLVTCPHSKPPLLNS